MITLIGFRWKHSNVLSREVLIVHILLGNLKSTICKNECLDEFPLWKSPNVQTHTCVKNKVENIKDCIISKKLSSQFW